MKKLFLSLLTASLLTLGATRAFAAEADSTAPKSIIHVITVAFKKDAKPEQIKAALDGVQKLPSEYKGLTHVWTKAIKVQNPAGATTAKTHVIVMEFANQAVFDAYTDSDAQKKWYELYIPIREQSTTYDITN